MYRYCNAMLADQKLQYIVGKAQKKTDIFLEELKEALKDVRGITCSLSTVWHTMQQAGYTLKKVCMASNSYITC